MKRDIQIAGDVRDVLNRSTVSGNTLFLPPAQLDRKLYRDVNKALEALGGKWNRSKKGHVFDGDPRAAIEAASETGKIAHPNQHDFFPTSREVAEMACHRLGMGDSWKRTLEPSAGEGDLFAPLVDWHGMPDWRPPRDELFLVELDPRRCASLREKGFEQHLYRGDFLSLDPRNFRAFDRILMNPPFERGSDVKHITHALSFLAPGGRLVAIASAGLKFRDDKATSALREQIEAWGGAIDELPAGSFEHAGTKVSTCLVVVDKPRVVAAPPPKRGSRKPQQTDLFVGRT